MRPPGHGGEGEREKGERERERPKEGGVVGREEVYSNMSYSVV